MKKRPKYFLASDKIDQDGEIFDRCVYPGTIGNLGNYLDDAINDLEQQSQEAHDEQI